MPRPPKDTRRNKSGSRKIVDERKAHQKSVHVKTASRRKASSTRWLKRQLNDPFVTAAKQDGYKSRAAYKLIEMNDQFDFLKPGARIVDLGAAPGGWTQIAVKHTRPQETGGCVIGLDILPMDPITGATLLEMDFHDPSAPQRLITELGGHKANVVMSDMAAPTTGHKATDHLRIMALAELALDFALKVLAKDGVYLAKLFQGGAEHDLLNTLKSHFDQVKHVKPEASRKDSTEMYVIATGFRGEKKIE